jgi:hypothetical protein
MRKKKASHSMVSVFAPRQICGEDVEPFCIPNSGTTVSQMMAAATNLVWWSIHEALADGHIRDAVICRKILIDIVARELTDEQRLEAEAVIEEVFEKYREQSNDTN